jgi:hypothetical protein
MLSLNLVALRLHTPSVRTGAAGSTLGVGKVGRSPEQLLTALGASKQAGWGDS